MKKLIIIFVSVCLFPIGAYSNTGQVNTTATDASGSEVDSGGNDTASYIIGHSVTRSSTMTSSVSTARIDNVGQTKIGVITINNNTRDGYRSQL